MENIHEIKYIPIKHFLATSYNHGTYDWAIDVVEKYLRWLPQDDHVPSGMVYPSEVVSLLHHSFDEWEGEYGDYERAMSKLRTFSNHLESKDVYVFLY